MFISGKVFAEEKMDDQFLQAAIEEARQGLAEGGIPIGSVIVHGDKIIGRGHNRRTVTLRQERPVAVPRGAGRGIGADGEMMTRERMAPVDRS